MSAGDVKFVGWTGGSPAYKELAPQIQIEPAGNGLISKRVTINRICFDKDKAAVVGNLPTGNAALSSVYIDTDGSVKTQALGGGYTLLSVSDASVAKGFSRVSAQYAKTAFGTFEIGLPEGLSIVCENGICKIKYLNHVLEEIDSGTGECTSGLEIVAEEKQLLYVPPTGPYKTFRGVIGTLYVQSGFSQLRPDTPFYKYNLKCNGVTFETIEATKAEATNGKIISKQATQLVQIFGVTNADEYSNYLELQDYEQRTQELKAAHTLQQIELIGEIVEIRPSSVAINVPLLNVTNYYDEIVYEYKYVDLIEYKLNPSLLDPKWVKSGNIIQLVIDDKPIREYDVTGLT